MSKFSLYGFILACAIIAAALGALASHYREKAQSYELCFVAAKSFPEKAIHVCKEKAQIVAELVIERDMIEKCTAALNQNAYSPDCPTQVANLFIAHQNTKAQFAQMESEYAAAIKRADERVKELQSRKSQDDKIIQSAKRNVDGHIICDAECMRKRKF